MHVPQCACVEVRESFCATVCMRMRESTPVCHGVHSCFPWLGYMCTNAHRCMCALMFKILCPGIALTHHGFTNEEQKRGFMMCSLFSCHMRQSCL